MSRPSSSLSLPERLTTNDRFIVQVKVAVTEERQLTLEWERVRSFEKDVANVFLNLVKEQKRAK